MNECCWQESCSCPVGMLLCVDAMFRKPMYLPPIRGFHGEAIGCMKQAANYIIQSQDARFGSHITCVPYVGYIPKNVVDHWLKCSSDPKYAPFFDGDANVVIE